MIGDLDQKHLRRIIKKSPETEVEAGKIISHIDPMIEKINIKRTMTGHIKIGIEIENQAEIEEIEEMTEIVEIKRITEEAEIINITEVMEMEMAIGEEIETTTRIETLSQKNNKNKFQSKFQSKFQCPPKFQCQTKEL